MAMIVAWANHVLQVAEGKRKVPGKPGCFDEDTPIETEKGIIRIKKLKPGMILKKGEKVTAVFNIALRDKKMYYLDNIIISGSHKVFHDKKGWISIEKHPDAKLIKDYRKPVIYCYSTNSKRLHIGKHKFLDWDDLEPLDIIKLKNMRYLRKNSSMTDIHKNLESGIDGNTLIELENGNSVKIKHIKINDQLYFGERVIGLVKIETKDIASIKQYNLKNLEIIGAPNLHFKDSDLGILNTLNTTGKEVPKPKYLYHILTDSGYFMLNGYKMRDYNSAIENILDIKDKLFAMF